MNQEGIYRASENLKREKLLFITKSNPNSKETEAFELLVQLSEFIVQNEKLGWEQLASEKDG